MVDRERLAGCVVSMPTPTKGHYELDIPRLKEHITWLIDEGFVEGRAVIMADSGLGAGYFLTREEHDDAMNALVDAANGRVPTMVGIFDGCTKEAARKAKRAQDVGVDFLQVNPPHYLAPVDDEVFTHYQWVNDASECGIMVYNTPWAAMNYEIRPRLMSRLVGLDRVVGVKWSSNDPVNWANTLKQFSGRVNFIDNSGLTPLAYQLGAKGYISFLGNIAPKAELYLLKLLESKQWDRFDTESKRLTAWREVLGSAEELSYEGVGEGSMSAAIFEAIGKPMGAPMPPQRRISAQSVNMIKEILAKNRVLEMLDEVG